MKMDEFRRQMETTRWPILLRVDGKETAVNARQDVMIPTAGELVCIYQDGAFEILDVSHIAIIRREVASQA